jgi:hypothetical protein
MDKTYEIVADALGRAGIRCLLGGGFAVNVHGFERGTKDIDLLIAEDDRQRADDELLRAGLRCFRRVDVVSRYEPPAGMNLVVDVLPLNRKTFESLWAAAVERPFLGRQARFVSFEHLLAMKIHTLKHDNMTRGLKDLLDITALAKANGWGPDTPQLCELCRKFGSPEILASVQKALSES